VKDWGGFRLIGLVEAREREVYEGGRVSWVELESKMVEGNTYQGTGPVPGLEPMLIDISKKRLKFS